MIKIITGPPGAGKGMYLIQLIRDALLNTNKYVITNFAVNLGALNAFFQDQYPDRTIDVVDRIHKLEDEQLREFWRYRNHEVTLDNLTNEQAKRLEVPGGLPAAYALAASGKSVYYVLDEAQLYFGAREFASFGKAVAWYFTQHRKLGDDVALCCQSVSQIDKQIREVTQETVQMKNLGKQKKGIFTLPKMFVWHSYYQIPGKADEPMAVGTFRQKLPGGLQDCFDTAAGVGIQGGLADTNDKVKGVSWKWAALAVLIVGALLVKLPGWIAQGAVYGLGVTGTSKKVQEQLDAGKKKVPTGQGGARPPTIEVEACCGGEQVVPSVKEPKSASKAVAATGRAPLAVADKIYVRGWVALPGKAGFVQLSNGLRIPFDSGLIQNRDNNGVTINGMIYPWQPDFLGGDAPAPGNGVKHIVSIDPR